MSEQTARECVFCHKPLTEQDDVVVCPECGAPYHRACYEQAGRCVFTEKHGAGFAYHAPGEAPGAQQGPSGAGAQGPAGAGAPAHCPACGAQNPPQNIFCQRCGAALRGRPYTNGSAAAPGGAQNPYTGAPFGGPAPFPQGGPVLAAEYDGVTTQEWREYIGSSAMSYLYMFNRMDQKGSKASLCWVALLFAPAYFAYRKMWAWAAGTLALTMLLDIPAFLAISQAMGIALPSWISASSLSLWSDICFYASWILSIVLLLFSHYLFRRHAAKRILALRQAHGASADYHDVLMRKGGVSILGVIAVIAINMLPTLIPMLATWPNGVMNFYGSLYGDSVYNAFASSGYTSL